MPESNRNESNLSPSVRTRRHSLDGVYILRLHVRDTWLERLLIAAGGKTRVTQLDTLSNCPGPVLPDLSG
jgi:hypothetical protein